MNYSWGFIDGVVKSVARRVSFAPTRYSAGGVSLRPALAQTGAALDYENAAGDVLSNSVVAACVNAICQALPEAPILLEKRVGGNEFEPVYSHPVLDLLHNPNPYLSEAELWGVTTAFERTRGEAFWYFEYDSSHSVPREIWFRAPEYVQVLSDTSRFISGYNITSESGQVVALDEGDVVHFRHQLSTVNPRAGWSPIQTGKRQIVGDNGAATYHSAILRNAGAASLIISLKDAAAAGEVTPGQIDEYVQLFKRKVMGEGSGAILGMDLPLDVHKVGFSPDEMALDKLLEYYESRICALMGVNRRVINLGSDPTYENSKVALNDFWERTIVPMRRRHASTLSSQLLPLFGLDPAVYRLRFDFSEVEALRENVDALHARWRETFVAGGIDLFTFQEKIGLKPDESYRGRYAKPSQPLDKGDSGDEVKSVPLVLWEEDKHPRDRDGKFTSGIGTVAQPLSRIPEEPRLYTDEELIARGLRRSISKSEIQNKIRELNNQGADTETVARAVERILRKAIIEYAVVISTDGKFVLFKEGEANKVSFEYDELMLARRGIFIHNHPGGHRYPASDPRSRGMAFSLPDLSAACMLEYSQMRIVAPHIRFALGPPPEGWNADFWNEKMYPEFKREISEVQEALLKQVHAGKISPQRATALREITIVAGLSRKLGLKLEVKNL